MLFLYSFPQTFLPPEAWKEFQGEPRDTGSPNSSLPVLGAPRSRPPSTAGVGSASSQVDTAPLSETGVGSPGREGADPREGRRSERGSGLPRLPEQGSWPPGTGGHAPSLLSPQPPPSDPSTNSLVTAPGPTAHQEPGRAPLQAPKGFVDGTERQSLGPSWGRIVIQSHHNQGHKYAMFLDPVIPLFGIPPKDIIARGK